MAPPKNTAASTTYGDHEVIVPENKLRKVVSSRPLEPGEDDPVARAEKALADLSDPRVVIDTGGLSPEATELANALAARIGALSEDEIAGLLALLRRG